MAVDAVRRQRTAAHQTGIMRQLAEATFARRRQDTKFWAEIAHMAEAFGGELSDEITADVARIDQCMLNVGTLLHAMAKELEDRG